MVIILIHIGVLEHWSPGVMVNWCISYYNTPVLHHSIAPVLHDLKTLGNLGFTLSKFIVSFFDKLADALKYLLVTKIGPHARTRSRHGLPV